MVTLCNLIVRRLNFGSSTQEASQLAGKNFEVILVLYCLWKFVPATLSGVVNIFKGFRCLLSAV